MHKAIFPGSFDPVTQGHIDIIIRSAALFDEVVVVLLNNSEKNCLFSIEERLTFLRHACKAMANVRCVCDDGLTATFAEKEGAKAIIRGIRSVKDYEYERDIACVNQHIAKGIETVFLLSDVKYAFVSSSIIKEMVKYQQDVTDFVSEEVALALCAKCKERQ